MPGPFGPIVPKLFNAKPDVKSYKVIKNIEMFPEWYEHTVATGRSHQIDEIFDPTYVPQDAYAMEDFWRKQAWFYAVLVNIIQYTTGKTIVRYHKLDYNAQVCMTQLIDDAQTSTHAVVSSRKIMKMLTHTRLDSSWTKSTLEFINNFERLIDEYNDKQRDPRQKIAEPFMKMLLQAAVSGVAMLRGVSDREQDRMIQGGQAYTWPQYLQALRSSATTYDEGRLSRHTGRSANVTDWMESYEDSNGDDDGPTGEVIEMCINEVRRRMPGSQMNKKAWDSMSPEGKKTWDLLSDKDKIAVLTYARDRAQRTQNKLTTNVHMAITDGEETTQVNVAEQSDPTKDDDHQPSSDYEINNALTDARSNAHPADPRRMMGSDKPSTGTERKVGYHSWNRSDADDESSDEDGLASMIDEYWNDTEDFQ
jgi:hypothetical protein